MADAGVTQAQAAAALGVAQSQLSRRLSGRINFRVSEMTTIAGICGVPASSLLADREGVAA
jgi:transcriptional regulator with XRE-family HTH domain